jgi:hypothetical protein
LGRSFLRISLYFNDVEGCGRVPDEDKGEIKDVNLFEENVNKISFIFPLPKDNFIWYLWASSSVTLKGQTHCEVGAQSQGSADQQQSARLPKVFLSAAFVILQAVSWADWIQKG